MNNRKEDSNSSARGPCLLTDRAVGDRVPCYTRYCTPPHHLQHTLIHFQERGVFPRILAVLQQLPSTRLLLLQPCFERPHYLYPEDCTSSTTPQKAVSLRNAATLRVDHADSSLNRGRPTHRELVESKSTRRLQQNNCRRPSSSTVQPSLDRGNWKSAQTAQHLRHFSLHTLSRRYTSHC